MEDTPFSTLAVEPLRPRRFKPAGRVVYTHLSPLDVTFPCRSKVRGRKAAGLRYEKLATAALQTQISGLTVQPWIRFKNSDGAVRLCRPDLVRITANIVTIFEIKLKHTVDAYWQLVHLYAPVLRHCYPDRDIRLVEVCRFLDADVLYPIPNCLVADLQDFITRPSETQLGVLQWKP